MPASSRDSEPLPQERRVFAEHPHDPGAFGEWHGLQLRVFDVNAHRQGRAVTGDGVDDGFRDDAITERHFHRLVAFPTKAFHKERPDAWRDEPYGSRPGAALFDHQMSSIERDAEELRIDVVEDLIKIPDRSAGVF